MNSGFNGSRKLLIVKQPREYDAMLTYRPCLRRFTSIINDSRFFAAQSHYTHITVTVSTATEYLHF